MGGKKSKRSGTSYEYRVANWFDSKENWSGKRNILSGASQQFTEAVSKHDVRAWHHDLPIFLQIEAKKKTGNSKDPNKIIIQMDWLDGINFNKDELLVFATNRSPHYAFIPKKRFFQILGRSYEVEYIKTQIYSGKKQLTMHRETIDQAENGKYHLEWLGEEYVILLLEEFITLRETADLHDNLSFEDQIKRLTSLEKAEEFEKLNLNELNHKQKKLLYGKLEELESGEVINPLVHSESQFWLDDAFILMCPHCKEKITKKDITG